jgi:ligand-binding sensor domain-containing protein
LNNFTKNERLLSAYRGINIILPILVLIINILSFHQIFAQNEQIEFERYSNGPVECIYQDRIGYIWFAAWGTLYRYDGYNFIKIVSEGNIGFIITIYEDRSGNIWVGGMIGLGKFDPITETFTIYKPHPPSPETEWGNHILSILEDKEGILWVGTLDGLNIFDRKTLEFTCIRHDSASPGSLGDNAVKVIYEDKNEIYG